jgi:hypothetical protein
MTCLVVEPGTYSSPVKMEAVFINVTTTDRNGNFAGSSVSYKQSYTSPVVLGQVVTANDMRFQAFWSFGTNRNNPPSSSALRMGRHVGNDTATSRSQETLAYVVFESGQVSVGSRTALAGVGGATVLGYDNSPPYSYTLSSPLTSPNAAIVSQTSMRANAGSWAVSWLDSPFTSTSTLQTVLDTDSIGGNARTHAAENVAYLAFDGSGSAQSSLGPTSEVIRVVAKTSMWTTVSLVNTYTAPPVVVCSPHYEACEACSQYVHVFCVSDSILWVLPIVLLSNCSFPFLQRHI